MPCHYPEPPVNPNSFPLTRDHWHRAPNGAIMSDIMRAEFLYHFGGVYIDSDVTVFKPFDQLLALNAFAAYEPMGDKHIGNAVMGFSPNNDILREYIEQATSKFHLKNRTYSLGVHLFSKIAMEHHEKNPKSITLLPPDAFYPYGFSSRDRYAPWTEAHKNIPVEKPWVMAAHHWAGRWKKNASDKSFDAKAPEEILA